MKLDNNGTINLPFPTTEHVWYSAEFDEIRIIDDGHHWYWAWFCLPTEGVIYLGEL